MELMGLPGETALTLVAGFLNVLYAAIGTMIAFDLTARQITILGVVLGISHNLILETVILTKLKIATVRIAFFRAFMGIITGILMNLLLPQNIPSTMFFSSIVQKSSSSAAVAKFSWISTFEKIAITCIQIVIIIFIIMLIYEFLVFMKLGRKKIKNKIKFIPNSIGLSDNAFGPWMVGLFAGILYGAGILFQFEKDKKLSHKDSCLITVFLVIAHAIIEDIMIFAIVGGNFWWIISIRIFMAIFITKLLSINDLYKKFLWIGLLESK